MLSKSLTIFAPAKINLYLDIINRMSNGYHNIYSVMQTVDLYDVIKIAVYDCNEKKININCDNKTICNESNLAYKAADIFCRENNVNNAEIYIDIKKNIPVSAGLGGGSADAAAVLIALNTIFSYNLSKNDLCKLGVKIGADIPFCIMKGTMIAEGIGDILLPCHEMPDCNILIISKGDDISTKEAYEKYDELNLKRNMGNKYKSHKLIESLNKKDLNGICENLYNAFENVTDGISDSIEMMRNCGSLGVLMSGSGPAVYGIFQCSENDKITKVRDILKKQGFNTYLCHPCGNKDIIDFNDNL